MATLGGGIYGSGTFVRCTISDNFADGGGAMWGGGDFADCQFLTNAASSGYALGVVQSATFSRCTFSGNNGGAGTCISGGRFFSCIITNNEGGEPDTSFVGSLFANCLLVGNHGGGPSPVFGGGPFINCTVVGNTTSVARIVTGVITNCIVWDNTSFHPQPYSGAINYSTMQGWDGSLGGTSNNGFDPLLDASHHLLVGSSCIDSGDNDASPPGVFADLDGRIRFFDAPAPNTGHGAPPLVDRGAYEYGAPVLCYANCDGSTTPPVLNVVDFNCFLNRFAAGHHWQTATVPQPLRSERPRLHLLPQPVRGGCS